MNLRRKTLFLIGMTILCLIFFVYSISTFIIVDGFIKVEQKDVEKNVNRAIGAVNDDISNLKTMNRDWAWWDDTYRFIGDDNPEYIKAVLGDESVAGLRLNLIIYINNTGEIVYARGFDYREKKDLPIPEGVKKLINKDSVLLKHSGPQSNYSGIVLLPEGNLIITSYPILNSDGEGPIGGTLIFGRYLDEMELERLASITQMSLTLDRLDNKQLPGDFKAVLPLFSLDKKIITRPLNEGKVAGYAVLNDISGDPSLILRVDLPREIYNQGKVSVNYFLISLIFVGFIFGGMSIWLMEKKVVSRILRLNNDVTLIKNSHNPSKHVVVEGKDEISYLSISINDMLEGIEHSQAEQKKAEDELKKHHDQLEEIVESRTAQLNKSIQEKEVLLREIHHRVKNNMQIVSSLLMLQSQNIEDKKYKDVFIDSQNRIHAMALIHEKLYQSESIAQINFKEYVSDIVSNIIGSYGQKSNIQIDINVENIPIKIDYAVPCGLIINELVTNSLKYAFPDGRQGKIQISVTSNDNNMIRLSISDDGVGIPEDVDIRNTKTLGLELVTSLAEGQLHGEIILNRENGTEFQINFKHAKC
ncbi:MAG: ATP-binding protein [Candidatus Methanoperedens sp.]|nr:ATP-binding protein [Candidatus Methanoperedens sp.]